jgi:hypothetical protein
MTSKAVNTGLTSTHCTLPTRSGVWADRSIHTVVQGGVKDGRRLWPPNHQRQQPYPGELGSSRR